VDCEPFTAFVPDQAPEAVQAVALSAFHLSVVLVPLLMVLGVALMLTLGADDFTERVVDCVALPPAPVQVKV
jgi:ABC-type sulfate transport system permease subunit